PAYGSDVKLGPRFEYERVRKQTQPPLGASARGRSLEERKSERVGPRGLRGCTHREQLLGVRHSDGGQARDLLDDLPAPADRVERPENSQASRVARRGLDLVRDRRDLSSRLVVETLP